MTKGQYESIGINVVMVVVVITFGIIYFLKIKRNKLYCAAEYIKVSCGG